MQTPTVRKLKLIYRNMEQILDKLFESASKVRLLRLFIRNQDQFFTFQEILKRSRVKSVMVKSLLAKFLKIGLIKRKIAILKEKVTLTFKQKPPKTIIKTRKALVYYINKDFRLLSELHGLIAKDSFASRKKLLGELYKLGSVKLGIISGVFINSDKARTDLLVVGNNIKKARLNNFLGEIESEIGRPLQYTLMDTKEFAYRLDMYDRFLRDILEFPHEKLINKLKI